MTLDTTTIFSTLSFLLIFLGLVGSVIPVLPGPILILAGAIVFAVNDNFERVGVPTLVVLGVLTALAWGAELILTATFTRKAGASWKTVAGAMVGGILGGLVFNGILPLIGALLGAAIGAVTGVIVVERGINQREWPEAMRVSRNYLAGCLLGRVAEVSLCLLMVLIFALQAVL